MSVHWYLFLLLVALIKALTVQATQNEEPQAKATPPLPRCKDALGCS
jgi:hypothetical protein